MDLRSPLVVIIRGANPELDDGQVLLAALTVRAKHHAGFVELSELAIAAANRLNIAYPARDVAREFFRQLQNRLDVSVPGTKSPISDLMADLPPLLERIHRVLGARPVDESDLSKLLGQLYAMGKVGR